MTYELLIFYTDADGMGFELSVLDSARTILKTWLKDVIYDDGMRKKGLSSI